MMKSFLLAVASAILTSAPAFADQTPLHTIAVQGEAEVQLVPDFATIQVGVITQGKVVADALAENSARMSRVVDALRSQGIADKDIQTSNFAIQPKYETLPQGQYDYEAFRQIVGYYVSNNVIVSITDLTKIAPVIDATVEAGANDSGKVEFRIKNVAHHMDDARRAAVENAHHKAAVLAEASHLTLGPALSVVDNQADLNYDNNAHGALVETVVVTGSRIPPTILAGQVTILSQVTVLYATR